MPEKITKLQRWLDLIAYLVGRKYPVSVDEIMERVPAYALALAGGSEDASVRRMFERDKSELREIGVPIETVDFRVSGGREASQGYRISRRDFYLPYLELIGAAETEPSMRGVETLEVRPRELSAARAALERAAELPSFPLRREARGALLKLAFDHPYEEPERSSALVVQPPDAGAVRDRLKALTDALRRRKQVAFRYHGIYRDTDTDRDVAPYGLLFQGGHWYLIGHDRLRDAVRIFRLDRMEPPETNASRPEEPDYDIPEDFDLGRYRHRQAWELSDSDEAALEALVEFRFPASLWVDRNGYGERREQRPDGSSVRSFEVRQVNPFLRWVLSMGGEAEIHAPPELREAFVEMAQEVAALYGRES